MSALDALLVEHHQFCEYLYCTVGDSARAELAQLRADLKAAQARIAQLDKMIALNRYVMPPFDLIDDATAILALECVEKDRRIAEQARQLEEARNVMVGVVGFFDYRPARAWLAAHPAPDTEQQPPNGEGKP